MKKTVDEVTDVAFGGDVLAGAFSFYIRALDFWVTRELERRMAELPIARGKGHITAILVIDRTAGTTPSQIAELLMRDRPATGRMLDKMEDEGLITKERSGDDQRSVKIFITEKGRSVAQEIRAIIQAQEDEFYDFIPADERQELLRLLRNAYEGFQKKVREQREAED
jgi:DNA-binding MarR family transcriptional regulator